LVEVAKKIILKARITKSYGITQLQAEYEKTLTYELPISAEINRYRLLIRKIELNRQRLNLQYEFD
jgi:Tfp pilus assembly protein PilF